MNKDIIKGHWNEIKGKLKQQWGDLTDDDIAKINGSYDILIGRLQQRYGRDKAQLEKEINTFLEKNQYTEKY